jgi:hypothetical protein
MLKVSALCLNNDREIKDCRVSWAKNVGNDKAASPRKRFPQPDQSPAGATSNHKRRNSRQQMVLLP